MNPKMSKYSRNYVDETKYMLFLIIEEDQLLEKCNKIWNEVSKSINKEFDSDLVYNEKYLRIKIKSDESKINPNFLIDKIPKEGGHCISLSVILIDSVLKRSTNYYSQVFLEECKYIVK